jgi:HlyD family secretion protein
MDELEARITQAKAQASGVDVQKPKPEEIESARIHVQELQDSLDVAERTRRVIQLNLEEAERDFTRAQNLLNAGAVSKSFVDEAETRFKSLTQDLQRVILEQQAASKALEQARLAYERISGSIDDNEYIRESYLAEAAALEAQLAVLRNDLAKTDITAPVSGPILDKFVEDSRVLQAGAPLLTIGDMDSIEVESDILSEEITQINVEDPVEIFGKALRGKSIMGHVKRIYPSGFEKISSLGIEQQRVKILIDFDNSKAGLRPGTSVDVRVITEESPDTLAVPDRAVFRRENNWYVFQVVNGRAVQTPVELGLRNDEWAEIKEGLTAEDTIVAELTNDLANGARVTSLE